LFSNEAGAGTEALAHGAAKTSEPVREGLVAMLGPFIDTIIVCTTTALVILISGLYTTDNNGVTLTVMAFEQELGIFGRLLLFVSVITFSLSTMFGYSYYGRKCASYLFGSRIKPYYNYIYILVIVIASISTIDIAINFVDSCYALMVIPTMIGTILLSPKVIAASKEYFSKVDL
jgi:AGCS family alanine or glycine:cation symporter